jgi:hypothetical protein
MRDAFGRSKSPHYNTDYNPSTALGETGLLFGQPHPYVNHVTI